MTFSLDSALSVVTRLSALAQYDILGTEPEAEFDDLAELARTACNAPIATIGFLDLERERFKATAGIELSSCPIKDSFGARTIAVRQVLVIPDASQHPDFARIPLVAGPAGISFYAGAPLITRDGTPIGVLAVMDRTARADFSIEQRAALQTLARQVIAQLDLRRIVQDLALALCQKHAAAAAANELRLLLPLCSDCEAVQTDGEHSGSVEDYISHQTHPNLSHSICPECGEESSSPVSLRPQPYSKLLGSRFGGFAN